MKLSNPVILYLERNNMIDNFISYGVYMRFLTGLSYFNSAVLVAQRRGIGFAASEATWKNRFGREIKPGANPLVIIKPFAPIDLYFEACDTYSPKDAPLPDWIAEDSANIPNFPCRPFGVNIDSIIRMLNNHGVYYDEREMGERAGGTMEYCEVPVFVKAIILRNIQVFRRIMQWLLIQRNPLKRRQLQYFTRSDICCVVT